MSACLVALPSTVARRLALPRVLAGAVAASACGPRDEGCPADLQVQLRPAEQTLQVGQTVDARAQLWGCGGRLALVDTVTWHAHDTTVLQVDARSGRITARQPGQTEVSATGRQNGDLGAIHVRVIARP